MATGKLGASFNKLNNKLTDLLEENQRLKQQYKTLQEGNQETVRINSELKEKLQEKDRQVENLQHVLNLEKQKLVENQRFKQQYKTLQEGNRETVRINSELKGKLQEKDKQLKNLQHVLNFEKQKLIENQKFKQQYETLQEKNKETLRINSELKEKLLNLEKQCNEIQQLEEISQKFLEILDLDDITENDIKTLKEKNESLIDKNGEEPDNANDGDTPLDIHDIEGNSSKPSFNKSVGTSTTINFTDVRVVVGLDFGTTYSGFAYCHISNTSYICTNDQWPGEVGQLKTNTVLQYDDEYINVKSWGHTALYKRPSRKKNRNETKPVELFKLHLGNLQENLKPKLPVDYKKAITDYLREFGEIIKEKIDKSWSEIDFFENVLLVLTVPAEYSEKDRAVMRECAYNADLIGVRDSPKLQFTTEPEAAAIYCMENILKEYGLLAVETTFMIVDCGGGTVDLTIRKLVENNQLGEVTERMGDYCGSTFIDREFVRFLRGKLGNDAIDKLVENHYDQFQSMVQQFCRYVKLPFTGGNAGFSYDLDIEEYAPNLLQYVSKEARNIMENEDWIIEVKYDDVKMMFDPIIDRIISMIQLSNTLETCSAMFLVGGFSENRYLQKRVKQAFQHIMNTITVPNHPIAAIARGAAIYGSNMGKMEVCTIIRSRVLKVTYGVKIRTYWTEKDPINRKRHDGNIDKFDCLVKRGTEMRSDEKITRSYKPLSPAHTRGVLSLYCTSQYEAKYCDEPGMELLGKIIVDLPGLGLDKVLFELKFGQLEITVTAKNEINGQMYRTSFEYD